MQDDDGEHARLQYFIAGANDFNSSRVPCSLVAEEPCNSELSERAILLEFKKMKNGSRVESPRGDPHKCDSCTSQLGQFHHQS